MPHEPWKFDARYCGQTAEAVIAKLKNFPKDKFPKELIGHKVESIAAMAAKMKLKAARVAMQLLNEAEPRK